MTTSTMRILLDDIVEKGFDTLLNDKRQMKNARPRHHPPR